MKELPIEMALAVKEEYLEKLYKKKEIKTLKCNHILTVEEKDTILKD
jgi:hypothetical protein